MKTEMILDMPYTAYRQHPAVANSDLSLIAKSPAHYKWRKENPEETKEHFIFGRALHKLLLEPDDFDKEFIFAPELNMRTKDGKAQMEAFIKGNSGMEILTTGMKTDLYGIVESIKNNAFVKKILNMCSQREVSMFWTDKETGVDCKGRADLITLGDPIIFDLKSSRDAGIDYFSRALYDYGYFRQAAYYSDGYEAITSMNPSFCFIVFEKEPPYGVMTYLIDQRAINAGQELYHRDLRTYKKCCETGIWESYPERIFDLDMPEWVYKKLQNEGVAA